MSAEIESIKAKMIKRIIFVMLIALTPPYFFATFRWFEIGWQDINYVHFALVLVVIFIAIFYKRISLRIKIYVLIAIFAILGLSSLWYFGFSGIHYFVIISIAFASIFVKRKVAIIIDVIISVFYITTGFFYVTGIKETTVELQILSHSFLQWMTIILSLVVFCAVFIVGFGGLFRELVDNIVEKTKFKNEREKYIMDLEITRGKLDATVEELRDLNSSKDKFFSIIAHDLIGPFSSILGFSHLLHDNYEELDYKKRKAFITLLHNGILNTYELLEDLLLWSRMQRNTVVYNPGRENLFLLTAKIIEILNISAVKKVIEINNHVPRDLYVKADNFMISTVIRNLVSNAIKFCSYEKGKIIISAKNFTDGRHKGMTGICVRDNGVGIPEATKSKLFDVGENCSTPGTENESGTGLGLPICYDFVKRNGGDIWVESEAGKGTAFYFTLKTEPKFIKE